VTVIDAKGMPDYQGTLPEDPWYDLDRDRFCSSCICKVTSEVAQTLLAWISKAKKVRDWADPLWNSILPIAERYE